MSSSASSSEKSAAKPWDSPDLREIDRTPNLKYRGCFSGPPHLSRPDTPVTSGQCPLMSGEDSRGIPVFRRSPESDSDRAGRNPGGPGPLAQIAVRRDSTRMPKESILSGGTAATQERRGESQEKKEACQSRLDRKKEKNNVHVQVIGNTHFSRIYEHCAPIRAP